MENKGACQHTTLHPSPMLSGRSVPEYAWCEHMYKYICKIEQTCICKMEHVCKIGVLLLQQVFSCYGMCSLIIE